MPLILGAQSAVATGFTVDNSCRFNIADRHYMHRTQTAGDRKTFTLSFWVKRSNVVDEQTFFSISNGASYMQLKFNASEYLEYNDGPSTIRFITSRVFRDPGAWMHICIKYDSTESVEADRWNLFINGTQETAFSTATYPGLNTDSQVNITSGVLRVGIDQSAVAGDYGGYLAEVVLTDGTAYEASDFGEFDEDSPTIWKPKKVSGLTFGTNGFYLNFQDSADFGSDVSGEGNDLTDVNLAAVDQCTDTSTNNFCTGNPLSKYSGVVLSNGNTTITKDSGWQSCMGTFGMDASKWYWEQKCVTTYANAGITMSKQDGTSHSAVDATRIMYSSDGNVYNGQGSTTATGTTFTTGDIISVALDCAGDTIKFYKNDVLIHTETESVISDNQWSPAWGMHLGSWDTNFGGSTAFTISSGNADENGYGNFEYAVPSGYFALCTKNLGSDGG